MLRDMIGLNPSMLTRLQFKNFAFTLDRRTYKEPLFSRICGLVIGWKKNMFFANISSFPTWALLGFQNLNQVRVRFENEDNVWISQIKSYNTTEFSVATMEGKLNVIVKRKKQYPGDPEYLFKCLLDQMRMFYC